MESILNREELKELIQAIYDDYDFANFNLHFVDEVEPHKVYVIKNNRIFNELTRTTLISVDSIVSNREIDELSLYGIDVKTHLFRKMVEATANKILTDIYKVNAIEWFYDRKSPVEIELTITNWYLYEEKTETGFRYILRFEIGEIV
jgi:hypothetical protein